MPDASRPRPTLALVALFVFLACLYFMTGGGHLYSGDGHSIYQTTRAMVDRHELSIDPNNYVYGATGTDGEFYSKFGIGQAVIAIPFYLVAKQVVILLESRGMEALAGKDPSDLAMPVTYTLNQFVTAGVVVAFCAILLSLGLALRSALLAGIVLGVSTMLWPYATWFLSEPLLALCLVLGFLALIRHGKTGSWSTVLAAGLFLGIGFLVKLSAIVLVPVYALYLAHRATAGRRLRMILLLGTPVAVAVAFYLYLNQIRFGGPFETGYGREHGLFTLDFQKGILGQLVSPGKSVFLFSPILVAALFFVPAAARRCRAETIFSVAVFLVFVVFHGGYHAWEGGYCWGPRYLAAVIPFAFFPVACGIDWIVTTPTDRRGFWRRAALALIVVLGIAGIVVQLLGVLGNFHEYSTVFLPEFQPDYVDKFCIPLMSWTFDRSHLVANAWLISIGRIDLWSVIYFKEGVPLKVILPVAAFVTLVMIGSWRLLSRSMSRANQVVAPVPAATVDRDREAT